MVQFVYFVKYLHRCLRVPQENRMDIFKERNKLELMNLDDLILLRIPKYRINCRQNIDNLIFVVYNERVFPSLLYCLRRVLTAVWSFWKAAANLDIALTCQYFITKQMCTQITPVLIPEALFQSITLK